jgi:hypothetical protein
LGREAKNLRIQGVVVVEDDTLETAGCWWEGTGSRRLAAAETAGTTDFIVPGAVRVVEAAKEEVARFCVGGCCEIDVGSSCCDCWGGIGHEEAAGALGWIEDGDKSSAVLFVLF